MTRPVASPMVTARVASLRSTRQRWVADMSPRASPRTTTVAVWVVPMPPIEATIGMNTASRASSRIEPSKRPITEAARMAVPRLISSQTRRFGNTVRAGSRTVSSPAAPPSRWMSSVASSRITSMTSSTVMTPRRRWPPSTTGMATRLYLATRRHLLLVGLRGHAHRLLLPEQPHRSCGVGGDEAAPREAPHEVVMVVHHVEDRGGLGHRGLADLLHRLGHRDVLPDGEHVGGHQPPGSLLAVLEEPLDLLGLLLLHEVQHLLDLLGGQLLQDLGGVVRPHPIENARDLALVERPGQLVERLISQLGEDGPGRLATEQAEESDLVREGELAERRCDVRGVGVLENLAQALAAPRLQQIPDGVGEPGCLAHGG